MDSLNARQINKKEKIHEPLFHITKRASIPMWKSWLIRAVAVIAALAACGILIVILTGLDPTSVYTKMYEGAFGTERRTWKLYQGIAILLCVSLAVTPAFKMRFWNIGAEGQVLIGGLATYACMHYLGPKLPIPTLVIVMVAASVLAGVIWAVVPAVFKAFWNTNETLFTLMMNYVAISLVSFFTNLWQPNGSAVLNVLDAYGVPQIGEYKYLHNILIVIGITVFMYIYLRFSKHGYEISVVGQSENTARYIGINVKKVIIRTLVLSGAVCGIAGFLLVGGTDHTIGTNTVAGRGFTAIMVSWLAKFNPFYMVLTTFLVVFLKEGTTNITTEFSLPTALADIVTALILLFIIGCEFFINYSIKMKKFRKGGND